MQVGKLAGITPGLVQCSAPLLGYDRLHMRHMCREYIVQQHCSAAFDGESLVACHACNVGHLPLSPIRTVPAGASTNRNISSRANTPGAGNTCTEQDSSEMPYAASLGLVHPHRRNMAVVQQQQGFRRPYTGSNNLPDICKARCLCRSHNCCET